MKSRVEYPLHVFWSDEDQGFIAVAPDLPGASAVGDTAEEALKEVHDAVAAWIDAAKAAGNEIPAPSQPSLARPSFAGKFALRMPSQLHERAAGQAASEGASLNLWLCTAISEHLGRVQNHQMAPATVAGGTTLLVVPPGLPNPIVSYQPLKSHSAAGYANFAREFVVATVHDSETLLRLTMVTPGSANPERLQ